MPVRKVRLVVWLVAAVTLFGGACEMPSGKSETSARSCRSEAEGKRVFETYSRVLKVAKDWERVGWLRQVPVTKWMACKHNLGSHAPIDDCLDKFAYDPKDQDLPINTAIDRCVERAKKRLAR